MSSRKPVGRSEGDPVARLVRHSSDDADESGTDYDPGPGNTDMLAPRTVAQMLDWGVVVPPVFALDLLLAGVLSVPVRLVVEFGLYLAYCAVLEGFWGGQTVGKAVMDLVVVDEDGTACTPWQALVRNLPALVAAAWIPYVAALVSIVSSEHHQRLFDRVADTAVVRA